MEYRANNRISGPAVEPMTAEQLDDFLRGEGVLESADSDLLGLLVTAAREHVERYISKALNTQTWKLTLDKLPGATERDLGWWDGVREGARVSTGGSRRIELPTGPLQSITSFTYYASDNTSAVFSSTKYFADTSGPVGRLILNTGQPWPVVTRDALGIEIEYVAGFGDNVSDIPADLRVAVRQLALHWYINREFTKDQSDLNQAVTPIHIQRILNMHKVRRL